MKLSNIGRMIFVSSDVYIIHKNRAFVNGFCKKS